MIIGNQPIRLPGVKPGICSGLILSGAVDPALKDGGLAQSRYHLKPFTLLVNSERGRFRERVKF